MDNNENIQVNPPVGEAVTQPQATAEQQAAAQPQAADAPNYQNPPSYQVPPYGQQAPIQPNAGYQVPPYQPQQGVPYQPYPQQMPPYQYQPPVNQRETGMATASMVLGIISIVCASPIVAIIGLVLGIIARSKVKGGKSKAGIICSIIGLVLGIILSILMKVLLDSLLSEIGGYSGLYSYYDLVARIGIF